MVTKPGVTNMQVLSWPASQDGLGFTSFREWQLTQYSKNRLGTGRPRNRSSMPVRVERVSHHEVVLTAPETHQVSHVVGSGSSFHRVTVAAAWSWPLNCLSYRR